MKRECPAKFVNTPIRWQIVLATSIVIAILNEEDKILKNFRLFLTEKMEKTLKKSFDCLAIPVPKKMLRAQKSEAA